MNKKMITILRIHHDGSTHKDAKAYNCFNNITDLSVNIIYDETCTFKSLLAIVNNYAYPAFSGVTQITQFCKEEVFTQYDSINPDSDKLKRNMKIEEVVSDFRNFLHKILPK